MTDPGGTAPQRGGRGRKAPWMAADSRSGEVRCPLCSSPNGAAAGFCRWCGTPLGRPTDPVLGTTTRRALDARQGTSLSTLLAAAVAVALLGGIGFVAANSGLLPGSDEGSPSPRSAASLDPSPGASGSAAPSASPATSPGPAASPSAPVATPDATSSVVPPSASPLPSTMPPAATGFTCEAASVADASSSGWRLVRSRWGPRNGFDQLALVLQRRRTDAPRATTVTVESMTGSEVTERYGLPAPASGDRAIVLSFEGPVQLPTEFDGDPDLTSIQELTATTDDGTVRAVIGVTGEGCHRLSAAGWAFQSAPQEVEIILDVQHE